MSKAGRPPSSPREAMADTRGALISSSHRARMHAAFCSGVVVEVHLLTG